MKLVRFFPVVLAAVVAVVPVDAQPAEDTTARILDAWKKRREAFKSVRYVVTGKVEVFFLDVPIPDFKNKLPKMPVEYPYRAEVLLDIPTGRFSFVGRRSVLSIGDGGFVEASAVTRFDGERTMIGAPPGGVVPRGVNDVMIQTGNLSREVFTAELWPLFHAHGITPTARKPISPKRLKQAASEEAFEYRGQMVHDGVHVSVLRTELQDAVPVLSDELFVDQKRDAAVVRHTYFTGKRPMARIDISWIKS